MARIKKEDQAKILIQVNEEHRPVRAVAAEFGCTPATIYALLVRSRRDSETAAATATAEQPPLALDPAVAVALELPAAPEPPLAVPEEGRVLRFASPPSPLPPGPMPPPAPSATSQPRQDLGLAAEDAGGKTAPRGLGARLAKPGMGLITRSAEGDESMMPFRSLDDLLSAIKPILRAGARSADPVWFSIQPIDLAAIDADAA